MLNETQKATLVAHRQISHLSEELNKIKKNKGNEVELLRKQVNNMSYENSSLNQQLYALKLEKENLLRKLREAENSKQPPRSIVGRVVFESKMPIKGFGYLAVEKDLVSLGSFTTD